MRWMNDRVPYRFTAIFAFDGDTLRNICLVDKQNAQVTHCPNQAITDSYCLYIHRSGEQFSVEEAKLDRRVDGPSEAARLSMLLGIPLLGPDGNLLGTVCHFDSAQVRVTDDVVSALDDLAPQIAAAAFPGKC